MENRHEIYFVSSDAECPLKIYFNDREAMNSGAPYLDSFDEAGEFVYSYKYNPSDKFYEMIN